MENTYFGKGGMHFAREILIGKFVDWNEWIASTQDFLCKARRGL